MSLEAGTFDVFKQLQHGQAVRLNLHNRVAGVVKKMGGAFGAPTSGRYSKQTMLLQTLIELKQEWSRLLTEIRRVDGISTTQRLSLYIEACINEFHFLTQTRWKQLERTCQEASHYSNLDE